MAYRWYATRSFDINISLIDLIQAHLHEPLAWWAHAVLDFVVGMTDDYINTLAHRLGL